MKKRIALLLLVIFGALGGSGAYAAQFTGKVTTNNGTTPVASLAVYAYKYNAETRSYENVGSAYTDNQGAFTLTPNGPPASHIGVYLVSFSVDNPYRGDPFYYYYYYYANPLAIYYNETYDDVTPLTPTRPPKQIIITNGSQTYDIGLVKLNRKTVGCIVSDAITINGVSYTYFSSYSTGPKLPTTGGTLNISFILRNLGSTAFTTQVQPLAFLRRRNVPLLMDARSVRSFASETHTVAAKSTKMVSLSVPIPGALMAASPAGFYYQWAFNMGIQLVNSSVLPNSSSSMIMFPVLHETTLTSTVLDGPALDEAQKQFPEIVPLKLSEDGKILEWGPKPE